MYSKKTSTVVKSIREDIIEPVSLMRLTGILMLMLCMQVAARSNGQTVSISVKNVPMKQVLHEIQQQAGFNVVAVESLLDNGGTVSMNVRSVPMEEALKQCFKNKTLTYSLEGRTIVIKRSSVPVVTAPAPAPVVVVPVPAEITGKVVDHEGMPMPSVTVYNVNTKKGTTTDKEGTYRIDANPGDIIYFSYTGYKGHQATISAFTKTLNVKMELSDNSMSEEVILTGYQRVKKTDMTGAVSKVKAEDMLLNGGTNTIEQALQGKMAGVVVSNTSGQVGTRQTIKVRGTSTLLGAQEPVWVVDGIIQEEPLPFRAAELNNFNDEPSNSELLKNFIGSAVSWLNPFDIEDVTVLKDAASTAIYGVKAANGVILINTKRGKAGTKPVISYNGSLSTQSKYSYDKLNLMNSRERVDVSREAWEKGLQLGPTSQYSTDDVGYSGLIRQYLEGKIKYEEFNTGVKQLEVNNTDWFGLLFDRPINQNHSISVSGGGTGGTYYGSFGYSNQRGQAINNGQNSYKASLNFTSIVSPRLNISARLSGDYTKTTGSYIVDPYRYAATTSRVIPAYAPDGQLFYYRGSNSKNFNVLNELANSGNENIKTSLNAVVSLRYRLPAGFQFESNLGVGYSNVNAEGVATELTNKVSGEFRGYEYGQYLPGSTEFLASRLPYGGELTAQNSRNINYTWRNGLTYGKTFYKKHAVTGLVGMELRSNMNKGLNNTIYGYMPDRGKTVAMPPATIIAGGNVQPNSLYGFSATPPAITDAVANYASYYFTGNYVYDNRYIFSASIRGDASNRFGQDTRQRFNPIWALGAKWNADREKWFDNAAWMTSLSFRASYGFQGNVAENFGPDLIAKIGTINSTTGERILTISNFPYTNLRWEKTQSVNLGVDFGFFKGRATGSADYYTKRSKDLIVMKEVPFENGTGAMPINDGTLINRGYDIALNFIPVRTKDFQWNLGVTTSRNVNKITKKQQQNSAWNTARSGSYLVDGYPVSSFWAFDYKGLDSATGRPTFNIPTTTENAAAKFDASQYMKYAGKLDPDFTTGFSTSFRYKKLTIGSNMYLSTGNQKFLAQLYTSDMVQAVPNEYNNLPAELVNRWRKPGDEKFTNIPSLPDGSVVLQMVKIPADNSTVSPYVLYNFSTARVVNASFLRINNINVNYTLPEKISQKVKSKSLTLGYTMSNVYTFVSKDYKGIDPEVASGGQPLPRMHVFTLAASF